MKPLIIFVIAVSFCFGCKNNHEPSKVEQLQIDTLQGTSFFNKPLIRRQIDPNRDSLQIANYNDALKRYDSDSLNVDNIVWLGRRIAYLGDYQKAIEIYTKGIELYPENAR
jgi:tetratricopeptide (TPR) repeat protein